MERRSFLKALLGFPVVAVILEVAIAEEAIWAVNPLEGYTDDYNFLFNGELAKYEIIRIEPICSSTSHHVWETYVL